MGKIQRALLLVAGIHLPLNAFADHFWQDLQSKPGVTRALDAQALNAKAASARRLSADIDALQAHFQTDQSTWTMALPLPDGSMATFELRPAQVMAPALALKYPSIITMKGSEAGNPDNRGRFEVTPHGFHGMFQYNGETVFIDPEQRGNTRQYISYYKKHALPLAALPTDHVMEDPAAPLATVFNRTATKDFGDTVTLRTYRLAVSTTGEYTANRGGTVAAALASINTLVNRLNEVFEQELAVNFELVANNDNIIFTDPQSDPFVNNSNSSDLNTNPTVLSQNIGNSNFDIGHVLTTQGGGVAFLGVVCSDRRKAQGVSGSRFPTGDSFYIDLVAHEVGHQFGASHTFNGTSRSCGGNRSTSSAYEPGSGSTIMAYSGICGAENIQRPSDAYFHARSLAQMKNHINFGSGASCGTPTPQSGNEEPRATAPADVTIPVNTPFVLEGDGEDSSSPDLLPQLTYTWEQYDLGPASSSAATMVDDGQRPIFRSWLPTSSPSRYFPRLGDVVRQRTTLGEAYPTTDRTLNFRLTVRNSIGGSAFDEMRVTTVTSAGPFSVSEPLSGAVWDPSEEVTVSWDVANTDVPPVNCANVDIYLSTDDGATFDRQLVSATPNDGTHTLPVPGTGTTRGRIQVRCSDNIFFAVNPGAFTINAPITPIITAQAAIDIDEDTSRTIQFSDLIVTDPDSDYPNGFTMALQTGTQYQVSAQTVTPAANFFGTLTVPVTVNDGNTDSEPFQLTITVNPVNDPPVAVADTASVDSDSGPNLIDLLANDTDVEGDSLTLTAVNYNGSGTVNITANQLSYTPAAGFSGSETVEYTVTDQNGATATGTATITVGTSGSGSNSGDNNSDSDGGGSGSDSGGGGSLGWIELFTLLFLLGASRRRAAGARQVSAPV